MAIRRIINRKELRNNMSRVHVYHDNESSKGGIGFAGLLQIAFIVLKLCGVIKWSWWWILAPTWIPIGIMLLAILIALIFVKD